MADDDFVEQIRKAADAKQKEVEAAQAQDREATEAHRQEQVNRKVKCNGICQKVFKPAMLSVAEALEKAGIFAPQARKIECDLQEEHCACFCEAHVRKTDASGKAARVVVKTTMTVADATTVTVMCYQASQEKDWPIARWLKLSAPVDGSPENYPHDLSQPTTEKLDDWHRKRLHDCAIVCAEWFGQLPGRRIE